MMGKLPLAISIFMGAPWLEPSIVSTEELTTSGTPKEIIQYLIKHGGFTPFVSEEMQDLYEKVGSIRREEHVRCVGRIRLMVRLISLPLRMM